MSEAKRADLLPGDLLAAPSPETVFDGRVEAEKRLSRRTGGVRADEIAASVLWLCSPGASFSVGVALPVDGGYTRTLITRTRVTPSTPAQSPDRPQEPAISRPSH